MEPASVKRRFMNYLIDGFCSTLLILGVFVFTLPIMIRMHGVPDISTAILSGAIMPVILFLYYFIFEIIFQKTPGKFVTATTVKTGSGKKASPEMIAVRSLVRLVPFEFLSLKNMTWWHDRWSHTGVYVDEKKESVWEMILKNPLHELGWREDTTGKFG